MSISNRRFKSNDKVLYRGVKWTVCKDTVYDDNKHLCYRIMRGAWRENVRGDRLTPAQ